MKPTGLWGTEAEPPRPRSFAWALFCAVMRRLGIGACIVTGLAAAGLVVWQVPLQLGHLAARLYGLQPNDGDWFGGCVVIGVTALLGFVVFSLLSTLFDGVVAEAREREKVRGWVRKRS